MRMSSKVRLAGILFVVVLSAGIFGFGPVRSILTHAGGRVARAAHAASSLPFHQYADGPYTVQGNKIIGADGQTYLFHGIGRDGLEFSCAGGGFLDPAHLAYLGPQGNNPANGTYWYANTVRLPLAQNFWFNGQPGQCTAAQYQATVKQTVDALTAMKLNVIIDLQWTDANGQAAGGAGWSLADNESVNFWQQVAPIYASYSNVLFELYNEPHPSTWQCWQQGCSITETMYVSACSCPQTETYTGVGMQALVDAVRGTGANNLVLVAGMDWGFDLSQITTYQLTGSNIVYDTHPYPYSEKMPPSWDNAFGNISQTYPVMSAESGEYDCGNAYMSQLLSYFDTHQIGWIGWAWISLGSVCGYPQLVTDYQGTPATNMGVLIYQHLLSYASVTLPSAGPTSSTWYFAEGRVGGGFQEFLTLENPSSNPCSVNIGYLYTPDRGTAQTKTVSVNVPAHARATEDVDKDLGTKATGPGITDSAIVTVNTGATPSCQGIVAERPMYFNALAVNSGSDVIGLTHLGQTFYFADLATGSQPGGGSYASFIAILNPPGGSPATVTATYYANGQTVGTQQVVVSGGTRGTIFPANASPALPARVAVVVTSTQQVAVELPTYFSNIQGGNAGIVSGAADVIGVQNLTNDWLFAEGYIGGQFQENFVIANLDSNNSTANVTINLEYTDGTTNPFQVTVNPFSQLTWNVNTHAVGAPAGAVSAEITSTAANIIVQREMFFRYNHAANGRTLTAIGGTDVIGQPATATSSSYSFAEGYANAGYDEWLTVQNPTGNVETITITLVNGKGTVYVFSINVVAHSRYTVDITGMVIQHVYHNGDGYMGYEVSMIAQSNTGIFLAERPMYWNASGTQGGSDVLGYNGG